MINYIFTVDRVSHSDVIFFPRFIFFHPRKGHSRGIVNYTRGTRLRMESVGIVGVIDSKFAITLCDFFFCLFFPISLFRLFCDDRSDPVTTRLAKMQISERVLCNRSGAPELFRSRENRVRVRL